MAKLLRILASVAIPVLTLGFLLELPALFDPDYKIKGIIHLVFIFLILSAAVAILLFVHSGTTEAAARAGDGSTIFTSPDWQLGHNLKVIGLLLLIGVLPAIGILLVVLPFLIRAGG